LPQVCLRTAPGLVARDGRQRPSERNGHRACGFAACLTEPGLQADWRSTQTPRRMGEHRVDLARLRDEIGPRQRIVAVVTIDLPKQALEFLDIAIDRRAEIVIGAVTATNLVERLRPAPDIEPAGERIRLAAAIAIPGIGHTVVIDHAGD